MMDGRALQTLFIVLSGFIIINTPVGPLDDTKTISKTCHTHTLALI
jgi:hypothetical protein